MAIGAGLIVLGQAGTLIAAYAPQAAIFPILIAFGAVLGLSLMVYNVNQQAIRQAVTPDRIFGRVQAGLYVLTAAAQVIGSLLGGAIGQTMGLRTAIAVGVVIALTSALPTIFSPLRKLQGVPAAA
jgi:MFS family permease